MEPSVMEFSDSEPAPSTPSQFLTEIADSGDMNELARHIIESGLMFDPDHADLVRRACLGSGEYSQLLSAIVGDPDGGDDGPSATGPSSPATPPQPAPAFRSRPMKRRKMMASNPFLLPKSVTVKRAVGGQKPRSRSAVLTNEAVRLYNCIAFAMDQFGVVLNGHMTVTWEEFGIHDDARAAAVLTEFNTRMNKWLKVEGTGRKRKGVTAQTLGSPERYFYAFIHENAREHGFHTHQLFSVNYGKSRAFAERAVEVLKRLTGVVQVPDNAIMFTPGTKRDGFAPYLPRYKESEVDRCWRWFRYLVKNLDPNQFVKVGDQCGVLREVLKITHDFNEPAPVTCSDLFGCSQNIGIGAQTKEGFVSRLDAGDWQNLFGAHDLQEWRFDMAAKRQAAEMDSVFANVTI
jgi:hypothetical protein